MAGILPKRIFISRRKALRRRTSCSLKPRHLYAEQPCFTAGEVQHKDDGSYSRSFDLSFGATGIDYTLKVQENSLSISCCKLF